MDSVGSCLASLRAAHTAQSDSREWQMGERLMNDKWRLTSPEYVGGWRRLKKWLRMVASLIFVLSFGDV